jgi:predicted peroxiredoxin
MLPPVRRIARIETIPFPRVRELAERVRAAGIGMMLAENGTDVGIPT